MDLIDRSTERRRGACWRAGPLEIPSLAWPRAVGAAPRACSAQTPSTTRHLSRRGAPRMRRAPGRAPSVSRPARRSGSQPRPVHRLGPGRAPAGAGLMRAGAGRVARGGGEGGWGGMAAAAERGRGPGRGSKDRRAGRRPPVLRVQGRHLT